MTKLSVFILSLSTALLAQPANAQWSVGGYVGQSNARSLVDCRDGQFPITTLTTTTLDQEAFNAAFSEASSNNFIEGDFLSDLIVTDQGFLDSFVSFDTNSVLDVLQRRADGEFDIEESTRIFGAPEDIFGSSEDLSIETIDGELSLISTLEPRFISADFTGGSGSVFTVVGDGDFDPTDLGEFLSGTESPLGGTTTEGLVQAFVLDQLSVVGTITESFGVFECQSDSTDVGYGLNVAYNFNKAWGLEFGYVDLGEFTTQTSTPGVDVSPFPISEEVDASAFYLAATGSYYYNEKWSVTGRVGIYRLEQDISLEFGSESLPIIAGDTIVGQGGIEFSENDEDFYYGISWNYDFSDPIQFQLRYDHFDADVFSFGVQYRFGK